MYYGFSNSICNKKKWGALKNCPIIRPIWPNIVFIIFFFWNSYKFRPKYEPIWSRLNQDAFLTRLIGSKPPIWQSTVQHRLLIVLPRTHDPYDMRSQPPRLCARGSPSYLHQWRRRSCCKFVFDLGRGEEERQWMYFYCHYSVAPIALPSIFFFFLGLILCNRILLPTKRRRKITWKKNIFVVIFHLILVFYNKIVFLFFYFIFHLIYTREIWFCWLNKGWKKLQ